MTQEEFQRAVAEAVEQTLAARKSWAGVVAAGIAKSKTMRLNAFLLALTGALVQFAPPEWRELALTVEAFTAAVLNMYVRFQTVESLAAKGMKK